MGAMVAKTSKQSSDAEAMNAKASKQFRKAEIWGLMQDFCLPILTIASIGLMAQAATDCSSAADLNSSTHCGSSYIVYAVAVGAVSSVLAFGMIAESYLVIDANPILSRGVSRGVPLFLALWWIIAAAVLTWQTSVPAYSNVGNAYFCCWFGFLSSATLFYAKVLRDNSIAIECCVKLPPLALSGLAVASLIVVISAATICTGNGLASTLAADTCNGANGWVLACGVISCVICTTLCLVPSTALSDHSQCAIAYFLVAWWACGVYVGTFGTGRGTAAIFRLPGNGYFSSWMALGLVVRRAMFYTSLTFNHPKEEEREQGQGQGQEQEGTGNAAIGQQGGIVEPPIASNV